MMIGDLSEDVAYGAPTALGTPRFYLIPLRARPTLPREPVKSRNAVKSCRQVPRARSCFDATFCAYA